MGSKVPYDTTLMDFDGGKGERAGGICKGQFGNEIKRYSM